MAIEVKCDYCGQRYRLPDESGGKIGKCKRCGILINIPKASADGSPSLIEPSATISDASVDEQEGFPWRTTAIVTSIVAVPVTLAIAALVVVSSSRHRAPEVAASAPPVQGQASAGNAPIPRTSAAPANRQVNASPSAASRGSDRPASPDSSRSARTGTPRYPVGRSTSRATDTGPVSRTRLPQYGTGTGARSGRGSPATGQSVDSLIATLKANQPQRGYARFQPMDAARSRSQADDAAQELLRIGTFEAVAACLQYGDSRSRYQAIQALGRIEDPRAVDLLATCLKDPDPGIQNAAVDVLRMKGSAASGLLADYVRTNKQREAPGGLPWPGRLSAGRMMGPSGMEDRQATAARRLAAKSLSQTHEPGSMDALVACLRDNDPQIRSSGAYGLAKIGPQGVDYLIQCLTDPDISIRDCAAEALGKSDDSRAIPPLAACLADRRCEIRWSVAQALTRLRYEPTTFQEKVDFYLAQDNTAGLVQMGSAVVESLIEELQSPAPASCAVKALGRIGDTRAVEPLAAALRVEHSGLVRTDVAEALWEFGDIRGVEFLVTSSTLSHWQTRGRRPEDRLASGTPRDLLACLYDPDAKIRGKAISAFARLGDKKAVAALRYALPDRELNPPLVSALSKLGWEPQSAEEEVYFWIARKDKRRIEQFWSQTTKVLLENVRSGIGRKVENGVYTFIALGRPEIIPELVSVLDSSESKETAEVYLNCGQEDLAQAAEDWAKRHGYTITRRAGRPQAQWGQW
ncbi:MAG: HEAT repeat domain-containing protein [Sedimentisphaerales bacterium]|nr:HEAT repeat domain-containing protein [Sedimentisphaerales bacterium]